VVGLGVLFDNLNYTYNANSNKIQKVDDISGETASFSDVANATDYTYNLDGSLASDANKGITIEYNYLKRPKKITFANTQTIDYQYDASGMKLREKDRAGVWTDYVGNKIYKNGVLYQTSHDEGRINAQSEYEFAIQDHLGSVRVMFRDNLGQAQITQAENFGAWGESLVGLNYYRTASNKQQFVYTGHERNEELGVFDAKARVYDPVVPRFWSVDEMAEKMRRHSPYNYAFNNPVRFIDPDGMAPDLTFSFEDKKTAQQDKADLQAHINQGLGGYATATIGENGKVTITNTEGKNIADASPEVQAFYGTINGAVSSATDVKIGVVNNSFDVSTGDYDQSRIDIADINAYGKIDNTSGVANAASPQSKLSHEITEQTGKQEAGFKKGEGFNGLHFDKAIPVENKVIGNGVTRIPYSDTEPQPTQGGQYSQTDYKVGKMRVTVTLFEQKGRTIVVQQKK
jgi:RHS repeat-associated protein